MGFRVQQRVTVADGEFWQDRGWPEAAGDDPATRRGP
jgi:hypothetical protein